MLTGILRRKLGPHPPAFRCESPEGSSLLFETQLAETPRDGGKIMRKAVCICLSILTEASPRTIGTTKIWVQWLSLQGCFKLEKRCEGAVGGFDAHLLGAEKAV